METETIEAPESARGGETEEKPEFRIDSESSANWLLRKLAAIQEEEARIRAQARKRADELRADRDRLTHLFGAQLEEWARAEAARRRRKSVTLLHGTCAFRSSPARLEVADVDTAFDVARTLGIGLKLDPGAYRRYAQKALDDTGELLPGVAMTEGREVFSVRFASEESESAEASE